jgi:hypothetical protein
MNFHENKNQFVEMNEAMQHYVFMNKQNMEEKKNWIFLQVEELNFLLYVQNSNMKYVKA